MKKTKRLIMSLIAFSSLCGEALAQQVKATDLEALPGETVSMTMLINTEGGSYIGLEFDIQFPTEGFTTTGNATNSLEGWDGQFFIGDVGGVGIDNLVRCGVMSINTQGGTPMPGEGLHPIGTIEFTVGEDVPLGDYTVKLTNMTFIGDSRVSVPETTFTLSVVDVHNVVLDENATKAPTAAEGVNVHVLRTIQAGTWSTICLPFAMTEAQVMATFGNDTELADFTGCEATYDETEEKVIALKVNFADATGIEANHPYLIKVATNISQFDVENVDIEPEEEPSVDKDEYVTGKGTKKDPYVYHYNSFVGTYTAETVVPEYALFLSENKFWYSTGVTKMKAFRAYFDFYDVLSEVEEASARIQMDFNGGEVTGITENGKRTGLKVERLFDLQGRLVSSSIFHPNKEGKNGLSSKLKKGLYIRNGKKEVVR